MQSRVVELEKLRAEIWKLAMLAEDETTLVQTLLDRAGPVLDCENISFMPCDETLEKIVVELQWRADGQEVGLGESVPKWIPRRFAGRPYAQVSVDQAPRWLRPILSVFAKKYGTQSVLIIPYGDPHSPDGYIAVNNFTTAKVYSTEEIDLFTELAKIIHLRSTQLRSQAALQASEGRYRQIFETNQAMKMVVNPADGRIVEANQAAVRFYGYDYAILTQMRVADLDASSETALRQEMERARTEKQLLFNAQHRLASGELRDVEIYSGPVQTAQGEFLYSIIHDVTERRRTEQALRNSEERLALTVKGAELGTWDWNIQTGEVVFNERWAEMLGYTLAEIEPNITSWEKLMHPDEQAAVSAALTDHLQGRTPIYQIEQRLRAKSGEWKWVLDTGKVFEWDEQGRPLRATGTHQDITERKRLEQQLVQQERITVVGQLAAGIAHDFNNILTSILGYSELMLQSPQTPAAMRPRLQKISASSRRAAQLVRQLLDFSRKSLRRPKLFALDGFLQETINFLEHTIPENIWLTTNIAPGSYLIEADRTQLQQAITNLVINARDTMPAGGNLALDLARVEIDNPVPCSICDKPIRGEWFRLIVKDNGGGIPAEVLPHIFEPFFTTKAVGEGTGLGLSQVHGIINQHGGHITVKSQVGQGTIFAIYLPRAAEQPVEIEEVQHPSIILTGRGETILLVEDEATVAEAGKEMLEHLNYRVITVNNGREALTVFRKHHAEIALVLSDMVMPDMSGAALFAALKMEEPDLKMVIMSGYPLGENGTGLLEQGIVAWFEKPMSFEQLSQIVGQALAN
ncbi:MAG: PAS domain S-box protein [Anaerolineae bacterium]|nr:PAS domain S-box protein [Anaerolineae bacterium]